MCQSRYDTDRRLRKGGEPEVEVEEVESNKENTNNEINYVDNIYIHFCVVISGGVRLLPHCG